MATFPQRPRQSGVVVPEQPRWPGRLAARLVWVLVHGLSATLRYRLDDQAGITVLPDARSEPMIFCIWHNRLALCLRLYQKYFLNRQPNRRLAAMVSASRDGGLLARILELFDVQPVRGSSSRRGPQALRELVTWSEKGYDLAITPDGPRGPRYVVQDGVIALAQLTGRPIVPASINLSWKLQAGSWDRFQIPLPFARCLLAIGEPLRVPADLTDDGREAARLSLQSRMMNLTRDD